MQKEKKGALAPPPLTASVVKEAVKWSGSREHRERASTYLEGTALGRESTR